MYTCQQVLNSLGIFLELIGISYAVIKFPSKEEYTAPGPHISEDNGSHNLHKRPSYAELKRELFWGFILVGFGLMLELIAVFV